MSPTRFASGVTNAAVNEFGANMIAPDPTKLHTYFNDFDTFTSADWVITTTEAGTGSATEALTAGDGGLLLLTNAAGDDDLDFLQLAAETFRFATGKRLWFKARIKVSDATQSDLVIGLQITDTTPLAVSDGVYFQSDDGDALLDLHVTKDSASTSSTGIATLADDAWVEVAFAYDGKEAITGWVDGVKMATLATTNMPDDEDIAVSFGVQNGAAAAKTMTVDYIYVAKER